MNRWAGHCTMIHTDMSGKDPAGQSELTSNTAIGKEKPTGDPFSIQICFSYTCTFLFTAPICSRIAHICRATNSLN